MTPADAEPSGTELVRMSADESMTWARWAEDTNVGAFSLEQMWGQTQMLASQYLQPDSDPSSCSAALVNCALRPAGSIAVTSTPTRPASST
jgi:hypothetical protein